MHRHPKIMWTESMHVITLKEEDKLFTLLELQFTYHKDYHIIRNIVRNKVQYIWQNIYSIETQTPSQWIQMINITTVQSNTEIKIPKFRLLVTRRAWENWTSNIRSCVTQWDKTWVCVQDLYELWLTYSTHPVLTLETYIVGFCQIGMRIDALVSKWPSFSVDPSQ